MVNMVKALVVVSLVVVVVLFFGALYSGIIGPDRTRVGADENQEVQPEPPVARAKFPEDLAPAARAQPVAGAADFAIANKPHKLAFLNPNGALHKWQENAVGPTEDWAATKVEETELVVVVTPQTKTMIERARLRNGPLVDRNRFELDASVIEAKTGKRLATRTFVNMPRPIARHESFEGTAFGSPVRYSTVFHWVAAQARYGFTAAANSQPLVTVVEER
jgi:hypothetical protein